MGCRNCWETVKEEVVCIELNFRHPLTSQAFPEAETHFLGVKTTKTNSSNPGFVDLAVLIQRSAPGLIVRVSRGILGHRSAPVVPRRPGNLVCGGRAWQDFRKRLSHLNPG